MLLGLYRTATRLGGPWLAAGLRRRAARAKEDPMRLAERLGRPGLPRPPGPLLWLHAASVGEALGALPLLDALLAGRAALHVLLTTGTVTSARLLGGRLPARAMHQFVPLDRPSAWRSFFDHWQPDATLLVEAELWPNLILEATARGVPLGLVNGRMSPRSHRRWSRVPATAARLLGAFEPCLVQSERDRERFASLGAKLPRALGNLKAAAPPLPVDPDALAALRCALGVRPTWLAASTHSGEEDAVFETHRRVAAEQPDLVTIIAPRHLERADELAAHAERLGLSCARRSAGHLPGPADAIYLVDTLGELGILYRVARVAFVGKSLSRPGGGQNPLEAARLGCPAVLGPHSENFAEAAARLVDAGGARRVADTGALAAVVGELLAAPSARAHGQSRTPRRGQRRWRARWHAGGAGRHARSGARAGRCAPLNSGARAARRHDRCCHSSGSSATPHDCAGASHHRNARPSP